MTTTTMTPALRARVIDAINRERESWDDDTRTDILVMSIMSIPDGPVDLPDDLTDVDEDSMDPATTLALQLDYFGIDA